MQSLVYGYAGIEKFNALINIPKSMTVKTCNKIVSKIIDVVNVIAEETMNYVKTRYLQMMILIPVFPGMVPENAKDFLVVMEFLPVFQLKMVKF